MVLFTVLVGLYLSYDGFSYYITPLEERFYHPRHDWFKPSGLFGQGLGVVGTFLILFGVSIYILHKRYNILGKRIRLKYLLEFHIFLCVLGPLLILFHTAFKFGGIVSIAFWSMVAVVASGVIGRFIYLQIPRTIEGRALSLNEVQDMKTNISEILNEKYDFDPATIQLFLSFTEAESNNGSKPSMSALLKALKSNGVKKEESNKIIQMVKSERSLSRKISRLETMKKYFKYWHVAHLPFALIMLVIVVIHVVIAFTFGYKWIF